MSNLRDRLKRIQEQKRNEKPKEVNKFFEISALYDIGWESCGFQTLKREVDVVSPLKQNVTLPESLAVIVPDLSWNDLPKLKDFVFFDLETTGLSGGAGTVAFLAAFGKFQKNNKLCITQYLLLDYPGENDFLEAALKEFQNEKSVIVTYNGKCFDSQILKTRCLMNGLKPPDYKHADLLHPARRLWKNIIYNCSQGSIETRILGLDRSGDIPGALAPEIWFEFLKTGKTERLMGICDHNISDIKGLATILTAMISIAADPLGTNYQYDISRIALHWRDFCRRRNSYFNPDMNDLQQTGIELLNHIANTNFSDSIKAVVLRALTIDSERRMKDISNALKFAKKALKLKDAGTFWLEYFEKKIRRLEKKLQEISH
jgi:uncharacterized protein YprB with RNaseH-like and TPR domain